MGSVVARARKVAPAPDQRPATGPRAGTPTFVHDPSGDGDLGEGWYAYRITAPFSLDQLHAELNTALGFPWGNSLTFTAYGTPATASPETPVLLYWLPPDPSLTPDRLVRVGLAHTPDPDWRPGGAPTPASVRDKASRGIDLDPGEIQLALRLLLTDG